MTYSQSRRQEPSRAVTACGIDHVRLSYHYLECDDIDGFGSLLEDDVMVDRPDAPPVRGRAEVVRMLLNRDIPQAQHVLDQVIADGDRVAVMGRLSQDSGLPTRTAFVDVFTLSETGMLRGCRRYYFVPPT